MASAIRDGEPTTAEERANNLYQKGSEAPQGTIFFQRDLHNMQVAESLADLLNLIGILVGQHLFKPMTFENEPCWEVRSRDEADKLRRLTPDERLLYHHIEQVGSEGVWSKALRNRTNVTQQVMNKCLKNLESKELVQSVMSVKFPNRKMYLLKHLIPSEDIAGGPWQSDGEFDAPLIEIVTSLIHQYVEKETSVHVPGDWNDWVAHDRAAAIAKKRTQVQVSDIEDTPLPSYRPPRSRSHFVPRADPRYPTIQSIRKFIVDSNIIRERKVRDEDIEQLLDVMVLEGRLEKMKGKSYRTPPGTKNTDSFNGFVDAPCGTCPVFDQCMDEGPISARTCVYFGEWLGTESDVIHRVVSF
ncbi:RNA polymerase Rpc34 [Amniculicola lignicola CBS 123094]|uniref:DNA-directed RNA polymerase III subunit RPC6 n=1 Tax=Amniculicola lignicola CBS 123094 TaxID=1392246 RepID=A0A6A5WX11_9PLEO|nr:RNA polymerase Rpc34 [Amniculicola lignicola CBS 123094]